VGLTAISKSEIDMGCTMKTDLENKQFPLRRDEDPRYKGKGAAVGKVVRESARTFVTEGYLLTKALNFGGMNRPIPAGECAITSLTLAGDIIYGATSGTQAHLFQYQYQPHQEAVIPLGAFPGETSIRHALVALPNGRLFAAGRKLYEISGTRFVGDVIQEWGVPTPKMEERAVPVEGEQVCCLLADPSGTSLYGLTEPSGTFFVYDVQDGYCRTLGPVDEIEHFSRDLAMDGEGRVYAAISAGEIAAYDPEADALEPSGMKVPSFPGRGLYTRVEAWACDPVRGRLYGGDVADGLLFYLDLAACKVVSLGKPTMQPYMRGLTVIPDGRLYGLAGAKEGMAHLFVYDPDDGSTRDLGVPCTGTERRWYGYEFETLLSTPEGRLIFGETDRVSHVFSYFPPIRGITEDTESN